MRITIFLILALVLQTFANDAYSQKTRLSLDYSNTKLVDVLDEIEELSEFYFLYNEKFLDTNREIDISVKNTKIQDVLDELFSGTDIVFTITDRKIILAPEFLSDAQQQKSVSGKITDDSGQPLPGVTVVIKGTIQGTVTGADGNYSLPNVPADATLVLSFVGMKTQEIAVSGKTTIDVVMQEESIGIDEVVAIGYGTQRKGNITGSIASVKSEELTVAPVASTSNALAGRMPGLVSLQSSGQPGYDDASLSIRGFGDALVIVDGVETDFNSIDADQIESVSILKDGSASIYGSRAGNGVVLITTKRGNIQKPTISLKSSYTMQGSTFIPKTSSSGQYTEMERESWVNSGSIGVEPFTLEEIQKYYDGTDPQYPNTNWYDVLIRDWAPQQQHSLSVKGGSEKIKYYGYLGYLDQETMFKKNAGGYSRYNLQTNIDAQILDNLSLRVDFASTIEDRKFASRPMDIGSPGGGKNSTVWGDFQATLPIYPSSLPDPTKIPYADGAGTGGAHISTNRDLWGYQDRNGQNIKGTIELNYSFKSIEGLTAKAFVNYMQNYSKTKYFSRPVDFYYYDYASDIYTLAGGLASNSLSITRSDNRTITGQFSLNYDHVFGENHHISGLALFEQIDYYSDYLYGNRTDFLTVAIDQMFAGGSENQQTTGSESEMGRESFVGRLNYSFKNKYLVEASLRADASAKFSTLKRRGYFPSLSLGWRLSEEDFLEEGLSMFDDLKLRASYGSSGRDNVVNFQYLSGYNLSPNSYVLGSSILQGVYATSLANPYLTWEEIEIYNLGMDFSLWNRKLYGEVDAFYRERTGIPATRETSLPSTFGADMPPENINSLNNRGFEFNMGTSGENGEFRWNVSGNISWTASKWGHYEEPVYDDPDQERIYKRSGRSTDEQYGYVSDGLFTSQDQIDNLGYDQDKKGNTTLAPGDIKYLDLNDDGIIDWKDQTNIGAGVIKVTDMGDTGKGFPHWMYGFNINVKYKDFDFSSLFQGAFGNSSYVNVRSGASSILYDIRWTEENNHSDGLYPRLGGSSTNSYTSDFWYRKADYLRLKTLSIGYNVPGEWLSKLNISKARFYCAGTNLLTFSGLTKYDIDPEAPSGGANFYYPQQKTITFGVDISF